ncbi:MAG: coiled coil domain-containing protein, partial [Desulfobacterales bacterium]
MNDKRDAFVQKLKAQLDEWNADINELETKADQAEVRAKIEYHKRIADLRARLKEVEDKIGELQQ